MKLSQLIRYINTIDTLSLSPLKDVVESKFNRITTDISHGHQEFDISTYVNDLDISRQSIFDKIDQSESLLNSLKEELLSKRQELEHDAFEKSYKIYDLQQAYPNITKLVLDEHQSHTWIHHEDDLKYYKDRISLYGSWQHAGMLIRPLSGNVISSMLQCDPLYLIDETPALLSPSRKLFTPQYQRRLRYKVVKEKNQAPYLLDLIPNNQLGFIVVNEFFNKRPIEIIKTYLEEFLLLLRSGGVVLFTFNDCDNSQSVANFESGLYTYVPGKLLTRIAEGLGYEILNYHSTDRNVHWLEIKKPGQSNSLRGGQTLGIVKKIEGQSS
jgi:predicted DNA-binding protein YlxM (UPF0122 family)